MNDLIKIYLNYHDKAWAETTKKSESARLNSISKALDGNPETLWKMLEENKVKPYSRVTTWSRVVSFWDWALEMGHMSGQNPYKIWRKKNARLFKHAYERKTPEISYEEARSRVEKISDLSIRRKALELLHSGLRYSESFTLTDAGVVVGKGGKRRNAFLPKVEGPEFTGAYWKFWKELGLVGLKPHTLRKLKATDLVRRGMDFRSICEAMGWSDMKTAMCYVAPIKKDEMRKFF